ncbi:AAA family ATPase [Actinacidiphila yanglinensis]|uniref:AAA family ATPase n=1 Tax=Actinacidiphila yanglinensis TaxID=310779 RepID=UPI000CDF1C34
MQRADTGTADSGRAPRPWWVYRGTGLPAHDVSLDEVLPPAPPWRTFDGVSAHPDLADRPREDRTEPAPPDEDPAEVQRRLGSSLSALGRNTVEGDMVNAALLLRRPLLVTGRPGTGKSTLAYRISRELGLGRVLRWPITSHSTLRSGLYAYDAVGRVHALAEQDRAEARAAASGNSDASGASDGAAGPADTATATDIGSFLQLGPLGTALLPYRHPRVLLVDEFDKSDMDFPNDLLDVFEAGEYVVPELARLRQRLVDVQTDDPGGSAYVADGRVRCRAFPVVVITSNGEREFPPAFLRRCLHLQMPEPDLDRLTDIVTAHLGAVAEEPRLRELIRGFAERSTRERGLAADQLLNALYLASSGAHSEGAEWEELLHAVWRRLDGPGSP